MNLFNYLEEQDFKNEYLKRFAEFPDALKYQKKFVEHAVVVPETEVKYIKDPNAVPNKCELNAFEYAKKNNMTVVKGYAFERNFPVEHWWVYDLKSKKHMETSPIDEPFGSYRIGNIIKPEIFREAPSFKYLIPIDLNTDIITN